jgi:hypothetical protein
MKQFTKLFDTDPFGPVTALESDRLAGILQVLNIL